MRENDQQLGQPMRAYQDAKANIVALGLGAGDEGCIAYATDTDESGAFDGAAWAWSNHNLLGTRHSDATTDAVTRGSLIYGSATPAWDELAHPGAAYHLQTDANDVAWAQNITMANGAMVGIGPAAERIVFDAAGNITVMGAKFGVGIAAPDGTVHVHTATAGVVDAHADGDDLVVENSASGGITILVPDASDANIHLGTLSDRVGALIRWTYATPRLLMGTATAGGTVVICSANATTGIHIDANQQVGIACIPNSRFEIRLATKNLEIVNAGTAGASFNHWIEVEIGGTTAYIRVYATK